MFNSSPQLLAKLIIRSQWKRWIIPLVCSLPYLFSLFWLVYRGSIWIAQIMLAPILMTFLLAALTFVLAHLEFRR